MQGFSILSQLFGNVINTGLVKGVYHGVIMQNLYNGGIMPVAPVNGRYVSVGVDDRKGFTAYCRVLGSLDVDNVEKIGGCDSKIYRTRLLHRLVFFNNSEKRDHDTLTGILLKAVMSSPKIVFQKAILIRDRLLSEEAPSGKFNFTENTFYLGIDFFVLLALQAENCEQEISCQQAENPFCRVQ